MSSSSPFRIGCVFLTSTLFLCTAEAKTWKTVSELSARESARIQTEKREPPRDDDLLPEERYPFEPPYTAEELGYLRMEFAPRLPAGPMRS